MGSRLYYNFYPKAVDTDASFMQQVDLRTANSRGLGDPTGLLGTPSRTPWILSR
jgi:hypothetical protein